MTISRIDLRGGLVTGLLLLAGLLSLPNAARAATLVADFNGDGLSDTATITAGSGVVTIAHGGSVGASQYVTFSDWLTFHAIETNGVAGQEIVATFADGRVFVIDDRARKTRNYNVWPDAGLYGQRILYLTELNGAAGSEILFIYAGGAVSVVDDRLHVVRMYNVPGFGFGGPVRYFMIADFNGTAGNEIMFSYVNGYSHVVDDRARAVRTYLYPTDGAAPAYANVDGVAGLEAIFSYGTTKVWVVDRTRSVSYH